MDRSRFHLRLGGALLGATLVTTAVWLGATVHPATAGSPGSNGLIAFTSQRDGNLEIYVMGADGTAQTRLTNDAANDLDPAWSPDGTRIAFTSNRGGNTDVYVMHPDGGNVTRLTTDASIDEHPDWSPDGTQITFTSRRDGNAEIYVMGADGTAQARLTTLAGTDRFPVWSPDGTRIAWERTLTATNREIFAMAPDGSNAVNLTNHLTHDEQPAWSPDGTRIVFRAKRSGDDLWIMGADGSSQTGAVLTAGGDFDPEWSPDGTALVFSSSRTGNNEVFTSAPDGSSQTVLAGSVALDSQPSWQPVAAPVAGSPSPVVSGTATLGSTLTAGTGTFGGTPPFTRTYQWRRCDENGASCADIDDATAPTLVLTGDDVGATLQVMVSAANPAGGASASSDPTPVVSGPPTPLSQPLVSGGAVVDSTLTVTAGAWRGSPAPTFTYQWQRCEADETACGDIAGAAGASLMLTRDEVGMVVRAVVTATNSLGSASATSTGSGVVGWQTGWPITMPDGLRPAPIASLPVIDAAPTSPAASVPSARRPAVSAHRWLRCRSSLGAPARSARWCQAGSRTFSP